MKRGAVSQGKRGAPVALSAALSVAAALASVTTCSALAQTPAAERSQAGIVKVVSGEVQVQRQQQALAAKVGDKLYPGDRIVTAEAAAVGITLRDDTLMSLGPKTSFVLEDFKFNESSGEGNVAVRVAKGTLRYVSGLIGKRAPERQQVATPTATIGIRGTDFIVEVAGE
ncbi:FecR domain-containing protein [Herbaspirillum sp. LeCh32-8]|nr:FecR domain-containing protein [Herbaspirillum sp. LeCh32-8]